MSQTVATIGSALVDIFIQSDEFSLQPANEGVLLCSKYGDKIEIGEFHLLTGGGASNTGVGFARRGYQVEVVAELGKDRFGDQVIDELAAEKIDTDRMIREKREQTGMSVILVSSDGGRTVMVHRGAASMLEESDVEWSSFTPDWVHLSSVAGEEALLQRVFSEQNRAGYGLSWTPGKKELELVTSNEFAISDITPTILLLNKQEWEQLSSVAEHFHQVCEYIVVTDGRNGGEVFSKGEMVEGYDIKPAPQPVDETGAGDSFAVGFVDGYLQQKSIKECCDLGKANAASVVMQYGAKAGLLST